MAVYGRKIMVLTGDLWLYDAGYGSHTTRPQPVGDSGRITGPYRRSVQLRWTALGTSVLTCKLDSGVYNE